MYLQGRERYVKSVVRIEKHKDLSVFFSWAWRSCNAFDFGLKSILQVIWIVNTPILFYFVLYSFTKIKKVHSKEIVRFIYIFSKLIVS